MSLVILSLEKRFKLKGPYWNVLLNGFWMVSCWNHSKCGLHLGWLTTLLFISNPVHWIKSEDDSVLGALLQGWIEATKNRQERQRLAEDEDLLSCLGDLCWCSTGRWTWGMENLGVETPLKKGPKPKRKRSVLQPSMFRGDIGFRECLTCQNYTPHCCILIVVSLYCEFLDGSSGFSFIWEWYTLHVCLFSTQLVQWFLCYLSGCRFLKCF